MVTRYQKVMVTSGQWTHTRALCWAKSNGDTWTQAAPPPCEGWAINCQEGQGVPRTPDSAAPSPCLLPCPTS